MQHTLLFLSSAFLTAVTIAPALLAQDADQDQIQQTNAPKLNGYFTVRPAKKADVEALQKQLEKFGPPATTTIPVSSYKVTSSRDGNSYSGTIVGSNPFTGGTSASVHTFIVPLKIVTNTIGINYDSSTGNFSTKSGVTTFDPNAADKSCLGSSNNVPVTLLQQSPITQSTATFTWGGTDLGTTQYIDAFQRANFYAVDNHSTYHVLLNPVTTVKEITVNVPAANGTTIPQPPFNACGRMGIVDINWFDNFVINTLIPSLKSQGVGPTTFPIFVVHNVVWAATPITNIGDCCYGGYHGAFQVGSTIQTYSPFDFDSTDLLGIGFLDTAIAAHEVGEWANDPFGNNPTPAWGHVGQQSGCQTNLEVGDPLTGTLAPTTVMPNGFSYHLQELAFFNWFYGKPSDGIHGWFSNNDVFYHDAGPVCQ
ncbi:MAG: hypothetical protein JOY62_01630 [Acidobacteriaceae bacterium]|nr:hypothetical protein [Acidobacteriaceae bacterium]MBV9778648.1 hypothetical protein [Acidobacteriaceae bacterium]